MADPHSRNSPVLYLQYIVLTGIILYFGKSLFIPLSFSLLISFIMYPVCHWLEKHRFSRAGAIFTCMLTLVLAFSGMVALLIEQVLKFSSEWPTLKIKMIESLESLSLYISSHYTVSKEEQIAWIRKTIDQATPDFISVIKSSIYSSGVWLVLIILIPVMSSLILYFRHAFVKVLLSLYPEEKVSVVQHILHMTVHTYYNFIKGMLVVYLVVGILNSLGLLLLGVPHAFLFGFIVAILTFIPYVGIIIGSLLPITVSWLTFNSIWYPVGVIAIFTFVQYLEANLIFPWAVSTRLRVNTLATILSILAGGIIWGAAGMILFIPFLAIFKLVADHSESMKPVSRILGDSNY